MEHSYFKDRISAFHDNELKNEEKQLIAEHLESCAECQGLLKELESLDAMVEKHSGLADGEYWEKSARKIEAAIGAEQKTEIIEVKPTSYRGLGWKLAGIAASVAVIAFIALYEGDIKEQVDKRRQAGVEEALPAGDTAADSTPESVSDLGGPAPERERAKDADGAEGQIEEEESSAVTNKKGEVFIRGGKAATRELTTTTPKSEPAEPEAPTEEKLKRLETNEMPADSVAGTIPRMSQIEVYQSVPPMERRDFAEAQDSGAGDEMEFSLDDTDEEVMVSLEQWRAKRDSVLALVTDEKQLGSASKITTMQAPLVAKMDKQQLAEVVDSISRELEKEDPVLTLLECQYQISRLTDSEEEREDAVAYLRKYLEDEDSEYKLQAAFYLQRLDEQ